MKKLILRQASEIKTRKSPDATVIDAWPNKTYPGCYIVEVDCPHCPKTHTHGVRNLIEPAGHRVAHCGSGKPNTGYYVTIPPGLKPSK